MKRKLVVCKECGHEKSVKFYDRAEADRMNINIAPPRCERCGSTNVQVYD